LGVFSDLEILSAHKSGQIIIEPFERAQLQPTSYDVRLGRYFIPMQHQRGTLNPFNGASIGEIFLPVQRAQSCEVWCRENGRLPFDGISPECPVIVLEPHARILAHTWESIGIAHDGTTSMHAKSTTGRLGIVVCKDAGWGDTGYVFQWTLEIQNDNDHEVVLVPGMRIAQVVFHRAGPAAMNYGSAGNYARSEAGESRDTMHPPMIPRTLELITEWPK
jgi:dCTP deaminase